MTIKNIIFDLGGVIINLDYNKSAEAFKKLGIGDFDVIYSQKKQEKVFDQFEKGALTAAQFRVIIKQYIHQPVSDEQIDAAWNAMLLDVPAEKIVLLNLLQSQYRLFLLSNTNVIHIKAFTEIIEKAYGKNVFEKIFDKIYYSCYLKMRKPAKEIFETVIYENNLLKEETIFIDDSQQHIEGAQAAGLSSYLLEKNQSLENLLRQLLP